MRVARWLWALLCWQLATVPAAGAAPVEVAVWHAYRGAEADTLEALLRRYAQQHPDVLPVPLALPYDSFVTKLEAAAPRGNGPDLFIAAHERVGAWSASGLVRPLTPDPGWHPVTAEALTWGGRVYGVPLAYKCLALFINRRLVPDAPATTDAWIAQARSLTGDGRYGMAWIADEPFFHVPWLYGFGGGMYARGPDGVEVPSLDQPGNVASMVWVRDLVEQGLLPREATGALVTQLFNEGRAATVVSGPWFIGEIAPGLDWGVAPLPTVSATGLPARPFLTVEAAMVSGFAAHPAEAEAIARWLASPEVAVERALRGRQLVATLAAAEAPEVAADPVLAAFRAQLDAVVPTPNRPDMALTWEPSARALRRVMRGAYTPELAARSAQTELLIMTRPAPPAANPTPYLLGAGALGTALALWLVRQVARHRAEVVRYAFAYGWVAPAGLAMAVLVFVPFAVGAAVSLFAHRDGTFTFVGLANFLDILLARDWPVTSPLSFYFTLAVTVLWTVANVVLHVGLGMALALLLREPWLRLRAVYRVLLIVPWAVPSYITALIWKGMFHRQFGAINALLTALGLEPVSWFSQWSTAFAANVVTNTWLGFPFMMVVTLGALQTIPRDLEQAAEVDGANAWQRFWHITLPLLRPALLPAVILGSVWTFNMFNVIYLVSGGEPDGGTEILVSEAYRWAFTRNFRYGYAAAYAVLIFLVLLGYSRITGRLLGRRVL